MRLPHFAKRPTSGLAALALVLAACSDSAAPDAPFSATGTSNDIAAVNATFQAPALESFTAVSDAIDATVGGSMSASIAAAPSHSTSPHDLAMRLAKKMTANFSLASTTPSFASSIPTQYAGKTFEYDVGTHQYVATDRTGAPADGVRFILYAIDPLTNKPAEPLNEVGYAQVTASESGTSATMTLTVVGGGVTYLSYTATATSSSSSAKLTVAGSVSNGTATATFKFTAVASSSGGASITYALTGPNSMSITINESISSGSGAITLQMDVRGPHGHLSLTGSIGTASSFNVYVNGDLFATITENGSTTTITGANGQQLSADEQQTLEDVLSAFGQAIGFLVTLVAPPSAV